jgi:hypothetical protein
MRSIIKQCLVNVIKACKKYKVDFHELLNEIEGG